MKIDNKLIEYVEDLSYLKLSDDEKTRLKAELEKILVSIQRLGELDTDGVTPMSHPFDRVNVFRDDIVCDSFDRELILANAPERNDEFFVVPKTVE